MKQVVTITGDNLVKVDASIMPAGSQGWNDGLDDKDKFKQIPLTLTFDISGVLNDGDVITKDIEPSLMLCAAMESFFIAERTPLKVEASAGMDMKSNREKYDKMAEMVSEWEARTIALPIRTGRKPGEASRLKSEVRDLTASNSMTKDLSGMLISYIQKIKSDVLLGIIQKAEGIPAHTWDVEKAKVEAELVNASRK